MQRLGTVFSQPKIIQGTCTIDLSQTKSERGQVDESDRERTSQSFLIK
jgi:hypothetical protein